jgi:hypothetical protein
MLIPSSEAEEYLYCNELVGHVKLLDLSLKLCILSSEIIPADHHPRLSEKIRHHCPRTGAAQQTARGLSDGGTAVL